MKNFILLTTLSVLFIGREIHATSPNCLSQPNGYLIANPSASNEYYMCKGNVPIPMACPQGLVFCTTDIIKACMDACPNFNMPNSGPMYPGESPIYNNPPSEPWQPQIPVQPPSNQPSEPWQPQIPMQPPNNQPSEPWQPQIPVQPPSNQPSEPWQPQIPVQPPGNQPSEPWQPQIPVQPPGNQPSEPWQPQIPIAPPVNPSNPNWIPTASPNNPGWIPTAATNPPWIPTAAPENPAWVPTAATASPNEVPTAPTQASPFDTSECVNRADGVLFPMPGSCSGYVMCVNGKTQPGSCLANKAFDATSGTCSQNVCQ